MWTQTNHKTIPQLLEDAPGGVTEHRRQALLRVLARLSAADAARLRVEECADEKTGVRYGLARCRAGRCYKIGGGKNKESHHAYQLWAVWN